MNMPVLKTERANHRTRPERDGGGAATRRTARDSLRSRILPRGADVAVSALSADLVTRCILLGSGRCCAGNPGATLPSPITVWRDT